MAPDSKSRSLLVESQEDHSSVKDSEILSNGLGKGNHAIVQSESSMTLSGKQEERVKQPIKLFNTVFLVVIHLCGLYSMTYAPYIRWQTWVWLAFMWHWAAIGVTGGVHRLWTHRTYKASTPLRIYLMFSYASAGMNDVFNWVRDHRVHHKFSETDADPHNAKRGFFFAHVGWLMMKKHPEVVRRGKEINMDDILNDPVCSYEIKHHWTLVGLMCFVLPTAIPMLCWQESFACAVASTMIRFPVILNGVWSVNSAAHLFGGRPFNKFISPAENRVVSFMTLGEGWHNYHHVFPWDYRASEMGYLNTTMHFLNFASLVGLASGLKTAPQALVKRVAERYGDGTHPEWAAAAPEVPEEAAEDISLVDTLPPPETINKIK